jgi:drug/metabolite transporter (DMT)-like permease
MGDEQRASPEEPPQNESLWRRAGKALPMLKRYPVLAGAVCGVLLRLAFSGPGGSPWSAMAGAFIFTAPILVGMVTVYLAERQHRRTWSYYISASKG